MMAAVTVPGLRPKTHADLERARAKIEWVDDDDLAEVGRKSRTGAALLGFLTWGGGRVYLGDVPRGLALIGALIGWSLLSGFLPAVLGPLVYMLVGTASAAWSYRGARAMGHFVSTRTELLVRGATQVPPQLAAGPPPATGAYAELIDRLRKVAQLGRAGVLHDAEVRDRKIDLLGAAAPPSRAELDELLYALLPLGDEGVLDAEDFEFLKELGGNK
jgi:hypothetical protein